MFKLQYKHLVKQNNTKIGFGEDKKDSHKGV